MPIYEYHCSVCKKEIELLIRGSEQPECPDCHSKKLERKLSVMAVPGARSGREADPAGGMCGRPQCGMYGCQGME